jgi:hypothetical protein
MGSPLPPVIANYFTEYFEEMAPETATHKTLCWFRYVDDTFVIWPHGPGKLADFLDHLNRDHVNIKFTKQTERDGHLPFLDNDIKPMAHWAIVYRKPTHNNLYLHANIGQPKFTWTADSYISCYPFARGLETHSTEKDARD